ncbi:MAG: mechanosensitive ion channel domain-containing protein [Planctomycetota bacterium]
MIFRFKPIVSAFLLIAFILASSASGASQDPQAQDPQVASTEPVWDDEQIKEKISEIESLGEQDEALKSQLLEFYNQALNRLEMIRQHQAATGVFKKQIETAPAKMEGIRAEIEALAAKAPSDVTVDLPPDSTLATLEPLLMKEQVVLSDLMSRTAKLESDLKTQQARPAALSQQMTEAEQRLTEIESEISTPPPSDQNPRITEANEVALGIRKLAREVEIAMLEQEQLSYGARLGLLEVTLEKAVLETAGAEARVAKIQALINELRQAEADQAKQEAEKVEQEALDKHPAVAEQARRNSELSQEWSELVSETENALALRTDRSQQLDSLTKSFANTKQQVDKVGLSRVLGEVLLNKAKELRELQDYRKGAEQRRDRISEASLRQYAHQVRLEELADLDGAVEKILASLAEEDLSEQQIGKIKEEIRPLLQSQQELLKQINGTYRELVNELTQLDTVERSLVDEARNFVLLIDERLLWSPSLPAAGWNTLKNLPGAVTWFVIPGKWIETGRVLIAEAIDVPVWTGLVVLLFLIPLFSRKRFRKSMEAISGKVGRVHEDSFGLTVKALLILSARAVPWPLVIWFSGLLLTKSLDAPEFSKAAGSTLMKVGFLFYFMLFLKLLCDPNGVASVHFRWPDRAVQLFRHNLMWLIPLFLPVAFTAVTVHQLSGEDMKVHDESLGRLAFIVGMIALAWFTQRILRLKGGIAEIYLAKNPDGWLARLRYLWYPAWVGLSLVMAFLAGMGYYHTAIQMTSRLLSTFGIVLGALILKDTILRGLLVAQRRLALARARQRREEEQAAKAEEEMREEQEDDEAVVLDVPKVDLSTISGQTRKLLRILINFSVIVALYFIWADVLPALGILHEVALWHHLVDGPEGPQLAPITLAGVLLSILVALITFVATVNIPGVLEIVILQRLPMEPGVRYAITTVSRYIIIAVGLVIAMSIIGVSWGNLQWLVAALSVGLGFGLQEIVANFVSGLIILFERPVRIGDTVTVGNVTGTVSRIRIRATTITDRDRKELIVPNKNFITGEVVNWTLADPVIRLIVPVGIAYGSDTVLAHKVMMDVVESNPVVLEEPKPRVLFRGFGDNTLNFEVRVFIRGGPNLIGSREAARHELHMAIDRACREHSIEIAFPQRDIHIRSIEVPLKIESSEKKPPELKGSE